MNTAPMRSRVSRTREFLGAPIGLAVSALAIWASLGRDDRVPSLFDPAVARAHLEEIAAEPHPVGSDRQAEVRDGLIERLAETGFLRAQQTAEIVKKNEDESDPAESGQAGAPDPPAPRASDPSPAPKEGEEGGDAQDQDEWPKELFNLSVRIEGSASTGCVLFVAHYDSRPETPGAADNGAAVACLLERVQFLAGRVRAGQPPRNDLIFLFTDGEELGLHGAQVFVRGHPWYEQVDCVVNFDAIGNDGPLVMFQTGPASAGLVELYARVAPHPVTTSLASSIYAQLPNDTDFTPFLEDGRPGLNFAIVGGGSAYHAPFDSPANLAPASFERLGGTLAALVEELGQVDLARVLPGEDSTPAANSAYFDLSGLGVVRYPRALALLVAGLGPLVLALGIFGQLRRTQLRPTDLAGGLIAFGSFVACSALLLALEWALLGPLGGLLADEGELRPRGNAGSTHLVLAGMVCLSVVAAGGLLRFLEESNGRRLVHKLSLASAGVWIPGLLGIYLLDPAAAAQLPWVALLMGSALLLETKCSWALPLFGCLALALLTPHLALAFQLLSTDVNLAVGMFALVVPLGSGPFLGWLAAHRPSIGLLVTLELSGTLLLLLGGRLAALGG